MAIIWNKLIPRWSGDTIEPPEAKKDVGYIAGDKPPAKWENWLRKGTYEALDETRDVIENIDSQLAQIEAEINTPDSASLSLTELQQIKSVTDSYASPAKLTLGGATLYNAVVNGDFSNGTTGWNIQNATHTVNNKIYSLTGVGTDVNVQAWQQTNVQYKTGNKIFIKCTFRLTNASCTLIKAFFTDKSGNNQHNIFALSSPTQNQIYTMYGVVSCTIDSTNMRIYIRHTYPDAATANGKVMEVDGNVGVFAIPMTGTPYENYTADQMNALVNTYFEGLKSTNKMEILTRGKNLFDKSTRTIRKTLDATGAEIVATTDFTSAFIKVKPSTTYFLSGKTVAKFYAQYDRNKNFISATSNTNGQIVTTANTTFLKISALESSVDSVILGQSTTALNYEQYQGSKAKIQCTDETKFTLAKLPNGIKNEILINDGKWRAIKRVERYVLQAADINSYSTSFTNLDLVQFVYTNIMNLKNVSTSDTIATKMTTSVSIPLNGAFSDNVSNVWKHYFNSGGIVITTPKGTYASLAAAQTALAGTVIYYELATPITIEEKDFAFYSISINGSISSNLGYTEFVVNDYNILASTDIEYSQNLAESIAEVAKNIDGIRDNYAQINQVSNPNLLINGDFRIWQRGTSFTANTLTQYTADRWMMLGRAGVYDDKVDKVSSGLKITTASSYILYFRQTLEFPNMVGKIVTASCSVDGIIYKFTADINTEAFNPNVTTPWGVFYTEYSTTTNLLSCSFAINPSKTITINWVKLELGSISTPFHPKSYAEELASCQRYYLNKASGRVGQVETNLLRFIVPAPATMRNLPTISSFTLNNMSGLAQTGFVASSFGIDGSTIIITANKTSHGLIDGNIVVNGLDAEIY